MSNKTTIKKNVIIYIASFANMKVPNIKDKYVLKDHPIKLDDRKLGFLALSLRGYLKTINPTKTVLATELRKKGMTVKQTYELIIKKAGV